jgi:hypothetical protein
MGSIPTELPQETDMIADKSLLLQRSKRHSVRYGFLQTPPPPLSSVG